ncbi:hypothetical protein [Streptomyces sp. NBC_01198]|uniref:hypothetical protein n=1 Tax=Streptomyces sp. NBC_01198 TaxID=2903769 RepID=UPI002E0EF2E0|nr:hypothetical protein OG702_24585 [Streptomyces sp. NBC_01198]
MTFERPLRLFTYIIGHSQLLLRGQQDSERGHSTTLEVLFKDVSALSVRDRYPSLIIRAASSQEEDELREAVPGAWYDARAFVLGEGLLGGFVVAGTVFWGESSAPETYGSFLVPDYSLPRFDPDQPHRSDCQTIYTPYPQRQ